MNEIFNKNRFFKLLRKEFSERTNIIVKIAAIFSLLLAVYWLSLIIFDGGAVSVSSRTGYLFAATFITMFIAPFNLYRNYNHPKRGIESVMLPASVTEKFLSMLTNTVVLLPLITFGSILIADAILATVTPKIFSGYIFSSLGSSQNSFVSILKALIAQFGFIFGNFLFQKNKALKTILTGAGLYMVLGLIMFFLFTTVFNMDFQALKGMNIKIENMSDLNKVPGFESIGPFIKGFYYSSLAIFYGLFPIGFLAGTFYKMKTQQY